MLARLIARLIDGYDPALEKPLSKARYTYRPGMETVKTESSTADRAIPEKRGRERWHDVCKAQGEMAVNKAYTPVEER